MKKGPYRRRPTFFERHPFDIDAILFGTLITLAVVLGVVFVVFLITAWPLLWEKP